MLVFEGREKLGYLEKNLLEQRREPTTNTAPHIPQNFEKKAPVHVKTLC